MALTSIGNRLTPSVPIEITFDAQTVATGTKITTIIGRMTASPLVDPGVVRDIISIGDSAAAQADVDAQAGAGSEIGLMVKAFIDANVLAGRSAFPAIRVAMLANAATSVDGATLATLQHLRSDMIVSPFPVLDAGTSGLIDLATQLSGVDRDLQGQFGTFVTAGSLKGPGQAYAYNSRRLIIANLPDTTTPPSQAEGIVAAAHAGAMMSIPFPYNPAKGIAIGGLKPPVKMSDRVVIDPNGSSEALLKAGVSPMYVAPGNVVSLLKTRTSYITLDDGTTTATDYTAWQQLTVLNDFKEQLYQISQQPPFANNPGGTKASKSVAEAFRGEVIRLALAFEDQGAFQAVKALSPQILVQPSTLSRGRFDVRVPVNVLPDLDVLAINIFATNDFDFSL